MTNVARLLVHPVDCILLTFFPLWSSVAYVRCGPKFSATFWHRNFFVTAQFIHCDPNLD